MQQSASCLRYRSSQVAPSLLLRHAYSSWEKPYHQRMSTQGILSLMSKVFPLTHSTFMPHAGATIILLNLHAWNYSSEPPTALTRFTGRSGDVLLVAVCKPPDLLAFPGDLSPSDVLALSCGDCGHNFGDRRLRALEIRERQFSDRRLCSLLSHSSFLAYVFHWARPTRARARHVITPDDLVGTIMNSIIMNHN